MKQWNLKLFWISLVVAAVGLVLMVVSAIFRSDLIIRYGIRNFDAAQKVLNGVMGLDMLMVLLNGSVLIKAVRQRKRQAQILTDYAEDSQNPELTRKRLAQLAQEMPSMRPVVDECIKQMDTMDSLQFRQERLIKSNNAVYLNETLTALDGVERRICRNLRNVINLCEAAGGDHAMLSQSKVRRFLQDNQEKLANAQKLLEVSTDWVNQYDAEQNADRSQVESWIAVIQKSLEE